MNPNIQAVINLINLIFTANGNQEITGPNSNSVLNAIVNALYQITGDPEYLNTDAKDNLVDAINELKDLLGQITSIKVYSGEDDPNTFDVNGGDYYTADFYSQTDPNVGTIALWIYTGVNGVDWLNLNSLIKNIFEGEANPNTNAPVGFDGKSGSLYYQRINGTQGTTDRGYWIYVSPVTGWINLMRDSYLEVANLPTTGISGVLYSRTSDNTLWRWQLGGSVQYPVSTWVQLVESNAVSYEEQTLTLEQQAQARENIGVTSSFYDQKWIWDAITNPEKEFSLDFVPIQTVWTYDTNTPIWMDDGDFEITGTTLKVNTELEDGAIIRYGYYHGNTTI